MANEQDFKQDDCVICIQPKGASSRFDLELNKMYIISNVKFPGVIRLYGKGTRSYISERFKKVGGIINDKDSKIIQSI